MAVAVHVHFEAHCGNSQAWRVEGVDRLQRQRCVTAKGLSLGSCEVLGSNVLCCGRRLGEVRLLGAARGLSCRKRHAEQGCDILYARLQALGEVHCVWLDVAMGQLRPVGNSTPLLQEKS